jgi:hypothetical protein
VGLYDENFDPDLIGTPEVCSILGVKPRTVLRLAREGTLTAGQQYSFGRLLFFQVSEVLALRRRIRSTSRLRPGPVLMIAKQAHKRKPGPDGWSLPRSGPLAKLLSNAVRQMLD